MKRRPMWPEDHAMASAYKAVLYDLRHALRFDDVTPKGDIRAGIRLCATMIASCREASESRWQAHDAGQRECDRINAEWAQSVVP